MCPIIVVLRVDLGRDRKVGPEVQSVESFIMR